MHHAGDLEPVLLVNTPRISVTICSTSNLPICYLSSWTLPPLETQTSLLYFFFFFSLINTYLTENLWIYPIFDKLNWPLRIVMFALCLIVETLILFGARGINKIIWGQSKPSNDLLLN